MEINNQEPSNDETSAENFASLAGRVYLGERELQAEDLTKGEAILRGAVVVEPERYLPTRIGPKELYWIYFMWIPWVYSLLFPSPENKSLSCTYTTGRG